MVYRVRIDSVAMRQIEQFAVYLRDYDEDFAIDQIRGWIVFSSSALLNRRLLGAIFR
jgi:hypothetical protein